MKRRTLLVGRDPHVRTPAGSALGHSLSLMILVSARQGLFSGEHRVPR